MNLIRPKMQAARRLTLAKKEEEDEEHVIFWKLSMEARKSRDEMGHKFHSEVLQCGATLVNFG